MHSVKSVSEFSSSNPTTLSLPNRTPISSLSPERITHTMAARTAPFMPQLAQRARLASLRAAPSSSFLQAVRTQRQPLAQRLPLLPTTFTRRAHSIPRPPQPQPAQPAQPKEAAAQEQSSEDAPVSEGERPDMKPAYYQLSFTCVPCGHRSHHNISKQGYHHGAVLITCPSCRNRHVISDHLGIFGDKKVTIEDIMRQKGQLVKRGSLGEDGDIEFWPDELYPEQDRKGDSDP
ncbi:DNL zinc finger-domain-containing protein [Stachybotrys elegans]|uniref:DNL zinc finger-domain-containing protein n=1 Tax=Stachybotrys elegans TaxID=80388 RepID=A0A8K0T4E6_9HYPO|nr:DNL zinc finger-domain-containing protein [Stachybotrys elegans]